MATTVKLNAVGSAITKRESPNLNIQLPEIAEMRSIDSLYFLFDKLPEEYKLRSLEKATINIFFPGTSGDYAYAYPTAEIIEPYKITWNNKPAINGSINRFSAGLVGYSEEWGVFTNYAGDIPGYAAQELLKSHSIRLDFSGYLYTEKSQFVPYIEVILLDENAQLEVKGKTFTGGYVNRLAYNVFKWELRVKAGYYTAEQPTEKNARFRWKLKESNSWNEVSTLNEQAYTAPANTFPAGEIEWHVIATDDIGREFTSPTYSIDTRDSAAVGTPMSPSNTVEDGSGPISFIWNHANNTGTGQTAADLQWSSDGATWNDLATINGSVKSYTAPANTFPAGTVYWRVRTYNSDDVAGAWSTPLTFVSVAAPPVPVVAADSKPYTTITWQSSGQLAYSVTVDGVEYGPRFGTDKTITLKERLENGLHRATVKVQGMYGLWSEAGDVDFQISNFPGAEIKLNVLFDHAPQLSWITEGAYSAFQIYRNGKLIGKSTDTSFVDNLAIGSCSYQLIGIMSDSNYTESNVVNSTVCLPCTMICDLERGEWQKLELSAKSYPERNFSESQNYSSRHFCGAALPVLELSQHRNKSGSFEVAFKCREDAEAFEKLMGKVVCIKSKAADMIIGGLLDWQRLQGEFYAAYSFTVNAVYWEDYKDETDS